MLEYLVKNSKIDSKEPKYEVIISKNEKYFWKSRKKKDIFGNNTMHIAFEINDLDLRYKMVELLLEEDIGDINKANIIGFLPHEVEHS